MSRTRAELQFKALSIILGGDVGQLPSAEDASALDGYIDGVVAELAAKTVVNISDPNDLPDEYFETLAQLVANAAADEFGGKADATKKRYFENELRVIARQQPGFGPQQTSYF